MTRVHKLCKVWIGVVWLIGLAMLSGADWLQFRGTDNTNLATGACPPTDLGASVAWKAGLPGRAVSGPIVVGKRVFVTASSGNRDDRLHVLCLDTDSGKSVWERQFWATGRTLTHPTSAVAANTPCSDGERVFALFSSNDLVCLDLEGNLLWLRGLTYDFPTAANDVGMASSPVVVGKTVIVQVESQGDSFVAGVNTNTGETRWKIQRPHAANWSSPTVLRGARREQDRVLVQCGENVNVLDPMTGQSTWSYDAACKTIPSASTDGERVYVPSEDGLMAFKRDLSSAASPLLWTEGRLSPSAPSPVARDGRVYVMKRSVLACADAETGKTLWETRVKGNSFWATPVLCGDYAYLVSADGVGQVVNIAGEKGQLVSQYDFGEPVLGSPAIVDGALYVRSEKRLWKIAKP